MKVQYKYGVADVAELTRVFKVKELVVDSAFNNTGQTVRRDRRSIQRVKVP